MRLHCDNEGLTISPTKAEVGSLLLRTCTTTGLDVHVGELAEVPWAGAWWCQVPFLPQQLAELPTDGLHADVLRDHIQV